MVLCRRIVLGVALGLLLALANAAPATARPLHDGDVTYDPVNATLQELSEGINDLGNIDKDSAYTAMYNLALEAKNLWSSMTDKAQDKTKTNLATKLISDELYGEIELKQTNAQIQAYTENDVAAMEGEAAMKSGINANGADQFLCNVIKVRQGVPVMDDFANMVSRIIAMAIDSTYVTGGTGVKLAVTDRLMRCGMAEGFDLKTSNPLDAEQPEACRAPVTLTGMGTSELDVNAAYLSRGEVYTLPPVKTISYEQNGVAQEVHVFNPEDEDPAVAESMKRWMQAAQYCHQVAGYRPPPPLGKGQLSPKGRAKMAKIAECRARQDLFAMRCSYRLARLTRPNCGDPDMKAFCATAIEACAAAKTMNLVLDPSYNSCTNGLSADQLEFVSIQLCDSTHRIESDALSGESEGQKLLNIARCSKLKSDWKIKLDREDANFRRAVEGLQDIRDCFIEADKM